MLRDYMLEEPFKPMPVPIGRCFKCGEQICEDDPYEEHYDLLFCAGYCYEESMKCPDCGEPVLEPGEHCERCAWTDRVYNMTENEFLDQVGAILDTYKVKVEADFGDAGKLEVWYGGSPEGLEALEKLYEAREVKYSRTKEAVVVYLEYKFEAA